MPLNPKKILWPTDFSPLSLHAGRYAHGLRDLFGAQMFVLHVVPPPVTPDVAVMLPADIPVSLSEPQLVKACQEGLQKLVKEHFAGDAAIHLDAHMGTPWVGICDYADRRQIDLIVVATHGRTGLERALIGSTAEQVVRHAHCPVLVVKSTGRGFSS